MENNKLLAEYLGLRIKIVKTKFKTKNSLMVLNVNDDEVFEWEPNTDWNQLMMVVEKIEKKATVIIDRDDCTIHVLDDYGDVEDAIYKIESPKIEAVYNACVEFVKNPDIDISPIEKENKKEFDE